VGVTVLIATHDLALVERYAGKILRLEGGRIA
jgi:ABC-type ATPase involved in cell division